MSATNATVCTCDSEDHTHDGGCPLYIADPMSPEREQYIAAVMRLGHPRWEAADIAAAVMAVRDAELAQIADEVARFGIYGSAASATKALVVRASELVSENVELRARVAALLSERQETNSRLVELTLALRSAEKRVAELEAAKVVTEYATRVHGIPWPEDGVLRSGDTFDRNDQQARLDRYRDAWPDAHLVQRTVRRDEWTEAE